MALFQKSVLNKHLNNLDNVKVALAYEKFQSNYNPNKIEQIKSLKEEEYQDGFLRDIFVDVFGYILRPDENYNLLREFKNQNDGKKADGAILKDDKALAVIELKSTKTKDLTKVTQQAFNYKNNQPDCKYVITSNFQKLRFYIDYAHEYEEFDLFNLQKDDFKLLYLILHKDNLLNNLPLQIKQETKFHEKEISDKLYKDYSSFKRKLFANLVKNHPDIDQLELFKKSQKLLDRFLFILFSEDSGLLPPNLITTIITKYRKLEELDYYQPLYDIFKQYFGYINNGDTKENISEYNGGLFKPDQLLDNLIIDDIVLINDLMKLSIYDFNTEVDVNILGHIFEHSLAEIEEITAQIEGTIADKKKSKRTSIRKKDGVFYTPKYITQYIVDNTVGTLCNEKRIELGIEEIEFDGTYRKTKGGLKKEGEKLFKTLNDYKDWLLTLKILDPACGSGAFLNQALNFLIAEHKNIDDILEELTGHSLPIFDTDKSILENNLFGVDINEESVEIAQLSLWLRTAKKGRKLSSLNNNIKCGNSLIDDPEVAGDKAFDWNVEFKDIMDNGGFDVVIGNPPYIVYIKSIVGKNTLDYVSSKYIFSEYNPNTYALFTDLGLNKLLKKNGYLGFIIPNSWLDGQYFSKMRLGVYNKIVKEIIYLKGTVFNEIVETTILLSKNQVGINKRLNLSSNVLNNELKSIDFDTTKFIKGFNPFVTIDNPLLDKLEQKFSKLKTNALVYRGLETRNNKEWLSESKKTEQYLPILLGRDVNRYNYSHSGTYVNFIKKEMKSNANEIMYIKPKILMRRTGSKIIATVEFESLFALKNLYLIIPNNSDQIYSMIAQLNSKLLSFYHKSKFSDENKAFAQFKVVDVGNFPCVDNSSSSFEVKVSIIIEINKDLQQKSQRFINRTKDTFEFEKISKKLNSFYDFDFKTFIFELKKQKVTLSLIQQDEWEDYFNAYKTEINQLQTKITQTDQQIDQMVYELYGLTDEEIGIVEGG